MSYNTPATRATGYIILATNWNEFVANFIAMAPDAFTADGDIYIASAANVGVKLAAFTSSTGVLKTANGGLQVALAVPDDDRILFWDEGAGTYAYLTAGTNLTISGTTMTADAPTEATQSDMEDSGTTNANRFVSPEVTKYFPGVAKVWATLATDGSNTATYNVACTAKAATGQYTITIDTDFSGTTYGILATVLTTGADRNAIAAVTSAGVYRIDTDDGSTATDLGNFSAAWGDQ